MQAEEKRDEWIALYCKEREHIAKAQEEGRVCVFGVFKLQQGLVHCRKQEGRGQQS